MHPHIPIQSIPQGLQNHHVQTSSIPTQTSTIHPSVPPVPPHTHTQYPNHYTNAPFIAPRPPYPPPMHPMNSLNPMTPMIPPFANPYQAIIQRAYQQKWEQIQRAKVIQELNAQKAATANADKNIEKVNAEINDNNNENNNKQNNENEHKNENEIDKQNNNSKNKNGICLYIGKLCSLITDEFFNKLLNGCGVVIKWKRMKETFGFVNFETPEGALRCINLMNNMKLYGQTINVSPPNKSKELIEKYKKGLNIIPLPKPIQVPLLFNNQKHIHNHENEIRSKSRSRSRS
eukprot:220420_1